MNRKNMLIVVTLMVGVINNAFSIGQEQREILYTLHTLDKNFVEVPMIVQNKDMFTGVLAMNIQLNEAQLKAAEKDFKNVVLKNVALFVGSHVAKVVLLLMINEMKNSTGWTISKRPFYMALEQIVAGGTFISGQLFAGLNIYNASQKRSALVEALVLDRKILAELEEIKDSFEHNAQLAGNLLSPAITQS